MTGSPEEGHTGLPARQLEIRLLVDVGSDPISGAFERAGDGARFSGWLELLSLLELSRATSGPENNETTTED